jgi:hypothetical protein
MILGKDIQIFGSSGALIAASKSCVIRKSNKAIEVSSSTSGDYEDYEAGRHSWTVDISYLIASDVSTLDMEGNVYTLNIKVGNSTVKSGQALCVQCDIQASNGNLATGSVKFQGKGPLTSGSSN